MNDMDLQALHEPFAPSEIEWRIGRAGKSQKGIWAKVLAYVTSRAIMDRLDQVCGPDKWQTDFREGDAHLHAGIGILVDDTWIWKWDGTGRLDASGGLSATDAGKGDFSNALKRAAVQWGVGRYLYWLPEGWASVHEDGEHYGRLPKDKGGDRFRWDPPTLPEWAQPGGRGRPGAGESPGRNGRPKTTHVKTARTLLQMAAWNNFVDVDQSARVEAALDSGEADRIERATEWLRDIIKEKNEERTA